MAALRATPGFRGRAPTGFVVGRPGTGLLDAGVTGGAIGSTGGIVDGGGGSSELGGPGGNGRIGLLGRFTSGPTMSDARSSFNPTFRLQVS